MERLAAGEPVVSVEAVVDGAADALEDSISDEVCLVVVREVKDGCTVRLETDDDEGDETGVRPLEGGDVPEELEIDEEPEEELKSDAGRDGLL
jgi:hypothetical protein